jgi:septum formation protein
MRVIVDGSSASPSGVQPVVLASGSPRRREILAWLGVDFVVSVPEVNEEALHRGSPRATALAVALGKAGAVMERVPKGTLVLAADTVVALNGDLLLKPADRGEAMDMLRRLSGRTHEVITGVAVGVAGGAVDLRASRALVTFRGLSEEEIADYVDSDQPYDKAGGYGIQGRAGAFVERLEGDYYSVVGLPAELVADMLAEHPSSAMARLRARELPRPNFPLPFYPS